ncbi:MAG: alpha-ribazole phosphatase family protein [Pseudomonadota bacterium]
MTDTLIDFIRHGEPEGGRLYRGNRIDDPLSETGWRQMWESVGSNAPWQTIVTSPMARCHSFATALAGRHGLPVSIQNDFREIGLGRWEGKTPEQVADEMPDQYSAFYADPAAHPPPGSEPVPAFGQRVAAALARVVSEFAQQHLLVIAHAGVIRAALGTALSAPPSAWYRTRVDYASLTRLRQTRFGLKLEFHNRVTGDW